MNLYESIKNLKEAEVIDTGKWGNDTIELINNEGGMFPFSIKIYSGDKDYTKDTYYFKTEEAGRKEFDRLCSLETKEFTKEDKKAFAESIDFNPLFDHLNDLVGKKINFTKNMEEDKYNASYSFNIKSEDITDTCGIFSRVLKSCIISSSTNGVAVNEDRTSLRYFARISLSYQHADGGSNGMELTSAFYEDGNWKFRDVK